MNVPYASTALMSTAATSPSASNAGNEPVVPHRMRKLRFIPLAVGAAAMGVGLWSGLLRLGIELPGGLPAIAEFHGALMIGGFLGTLISLERAVAIQRPWGYAAPGLSALGALALIADLPGVGAALFIAASAMLTAASAMLFVRQLALFTFVLLIAAASWGVGTLQWLIGNPMSDAVGWWLTFLALTIVAERVELSRLVAPPPWSQAVLAACIMLILLGDVHAEFGGAATHYTSLGLIGCAAWLLRHDVARRTIRKGGQIRFSAACLLLGHTWLGIAGVLSLFIPPGSATFSYDASVHAITIGFVLSMIFGHAPIILPAVTGWRVRYHAFAYLPLALLHASVMLRVASDMNEWIDLRPYSGYLTIIALAGYAVTLLVASLRHPDRASH